MLCTYIVVELVVQSSHLSLIEKKNETRRQEDNETHEKERKFNMTLQHCTRNVKAMLRRWTCEPMITH